MAPFAFEGLEALAEADIPQRERLSASPKGQARGPPAREVSGARFGGFETRAGVQSASR